MISKHPRLDEPSLRTEAPAPHIDAIMKALDATDRAVSPLMDLGMDPRVALILKEMEKAGALLVRNVDGEIFVDVYDKRRAIEFIDKLKAELVT